MNSRQIRPKYQDVDCKNCGTEHEHVLIEWEGAGDRDAEYLTGHAEIDTVPCQDDGCSAKLCTSCPQFQCDLCGLSFCADHRIRIGAEELCGVCVKQLIADGEPVDIRPEVRAA